MSILKKTLKKTEVLFWSFIPIFVLMGIWGINERVYIASDSSAIEFAFWKLCFGISLLFFGFGLWYWLCKRFKLKLSKILSIIHALGSGFSSIILLYFYGLFPLRRMPFQFSEELNLNEIILGGFILFVLSQLAMVVNGIFILIRRIRILMKSSTQH